MMGKRQTSPIHRNAVAAIDQLGIKSTRDAISMNVKMRCQRRDQINRSMVRLVSQAGS